MFNWNRNGKNRQNVGNAEDIIISNRRKYAIPHRHAAPANDKYLASILVICISPQNT